MSTLIVIGRDPMITYKITQMIGKRAERARVRQRRIDAILSPLVTIKRIIGL
jgi:hypothetical protein